MNIRLCNIAILSLAMAGCGTTSDIKPVSQPPSTQTAAVSIEAPPYASFNEVVVLDFVDGTDKSKIKAEKRLEYDEVMKVAVRNFADRIAAEIRKTGAYPTVSREPGEGEALQISGVITRYAAGNALLRLFIGMGAGSSYFDATVDISRQSDAAKLGQVIVDKNSWGLGGAIAASQNVEGFTQGAAEKIAKQLAEGRVGVPKK